jgi:hypothetical protein
VRTRIALAVGATLTAGRGVGAPHKVTRKDQEHRLFGEDGFEGVVARVAALERKLGIHDLAGFTASWPTG